MDHLPQRLGSKLSPPSTYYDAGRSKLSCNPSHIGLYRGQILGRYDEEWVPPVPLFFVTDPFKDLMSETETSSGDDRIIRESGIDARVAAIIRPALKGAGFRLVRVRLLAQNGLTLQVMAERPDGTMTVEDCEEASRAISPALDVEDPIEKAYNLEVSSPGIDRPLVRGSDFATWIGHLVKAETSILIGARKRFRGKIVAADDAGVTIEADKLAYGEEPTVTLPFDALSEAHLVLTDELIRDALKADKKARQEAKKNRRAGKRGTSEDTAEQAEE